MKCFYCYQEYRVSKRPLLSINDANLFSEGVGYCFEHRGKHTDANISKLMAQVERLYWDYTMKAMERSMMRQMQGPSVTERLFGGFFPCKY